MPDYSIRLHCTVCNTRHRRSRSDGNPPFGLYPQKFVMSVCGQCQCDMGYPSPEVKTRHFVDNATDEEMREDD